MSLVDITTLPAEDELMDPATKQYVDSSLAVSEARSEAKLAEFRAVVEAYTARAEEREIAAREREAAAREREDIRAKDVARRMLNYEATVASVKRAVITTGIVASLSTVFGVAAFNAALMQNIFAALEQGRLASPPQIEMRADMTRMQADMKQLQVDMKQLQTDMKQMQGDMKQMQTDVRGIKRQLASRPAALGR